jgi:hypothetical protein
VPSNSVRRVPLERECKSGFEDGEGPPFEVRAARASLNNGAGKGSSQEGDKGDQLCAEHWRCGCRNVGTLYKRNERTASSICSGSDGLYVNARTGRKLRREFLAMYTPSYKNRRPENAVLGHHHPCISQ